MSISLYALYSRFAGLHTGQGAAEEDRLVGIYYRSAAAPAMYFGLERSERHVEWFFR
jgi:hypothetical protein